MASKHDQQALPDIQFGLNQLGEETTAADLVRSKGQSTKLKVISEKKLMSWIESILNQHRAGQVDAMTDEEKQGLLAKAQMEIQRRLKLEQELSKERERRSAELQEAQSKLASSTKSTADYEAAIAAYKSQLEQRDTTINDLQQDTFDLQDELNQKVVLLKTTIEEKDRDKERLQGSLRNQMIRSSDLLAGVIGLDNDYYGSRHQTESPAAETASAEEQFYHDFDVCAAIIQSLANDLARLREIASTSGANDGQALLAGDLELLAQLKEGSLGAMDVASPVASLVEATKNARREAQALEIATNEATGLPAPAAPLSNVPEDGEPADIIAGTTQVVRELEALLARERGRLIALKSMADAADAERNEGENELEEMKAAYDDLVAQVVQQGVAAELHVPDSLNDVGISPAERAAAAKIILSQISTAPKIDPQVKAREADIAKQVSELGKSIAATSDHTEALHNNVVDLDDLLKRINKNADSVESSALLASTQATLNSLKQALAARDQDVKIAAANAASAAKLANEHEAALEAAHAHNATLSAQLRELGSVVFDDAKSDGPEVTQSYNVGQTRVGELQKALDGNDADRVTQSASALLEALRKDATKHRDKAIRAKAEIDHLAEENAELHDKADTLSKQLNDATNRADELLRSERELSKQLIAAATGDPRLADTAADLAITIDDQEATVSDLNAHTKQAVVQLVKRKQELDAELAAIKAKSEDIKTTTIARSQGLEKEIGRLTEDVTSKDGELQTLRTELQELTEQVDNERADAVETAATAKEIIQQLRSQMEHRDAELAVLREESTSSTTELADLRERAGGSEAATKLLGDTLGGLTKLASEDQELNPAREALEHALEEMPGEAGISLRPESAARIAKAAQGLVGTMALRRSEIVEAESEAATALHEAIARRDTLEAERAQSAARIKELEDELQNLSADAVETAATAKEMIQALQSQMASRDEKLNVFKANQDGQKSELAATKARMSQVDQANRELAECLAELTNAEMKTLPDLGQLEGIEEARVDLELVLSELPAEGEAGVEVSDDLGPRLAEAGRKAAIALAKRRSVITSDITATHLKAESTAKALEQLNTEVDAAKKSLADKESALKRAQAELESTRTDVKAQAADLSAKVQELTQARSTLASNKAELDELHSKTAHQEKELSQAKAEGTRAKQLATELEDAQKVAEATSAANQQLTEALAGLTNWDNRDTTNRIAKKGSKLAKASERLTARDNRTPEQVAAAGSEFIATLRERLQDLSNDADSTSKEVTAKQAETQRLNGELSAVKATLVTREQALQQAEHNAAEVQQFANAAEAAAAEMARAIGELDHGDESLTAAIADPTRLTNPETVQKAANSVRKAAEQQYQQNQQIAALQAQLDDAVTDQNRITTQLKQVSNEVAARTKEADEARRSEQALAAAAAELGRDLLTTAKAAAADTDPESAAEAGKLLNDYDNLSPERRVSAATSFMPTLRDLITTMAIRQAESASEMEFAQEQHALALQGLTEQLNKAQAQTKELSKASEQAQAAQQQVANELIGIRNQLDQATNSSLDLEEQLLQAQAELDEFRARGSANSGSSAAEIEELKLQVTATRSKLSDTELELSEAREKLETTEARMGKSREELSARLAERDELIIAKSREIEQMANNQADSAELNAKVEALAKDLATAHQQLQQYQQQQGDLSGASAKAGDLRKMLKSAETEREQMRSKLRELEAELADRKGDLEEAQAAVGAKQKELGNLRSKKEQEVEAERSAASKVRESERQLKEENVGLKARLRRLTER